ncbi:7165_t:CDS:2 [Entrophospora sp. SA101]|nr:7165_t:CDS:2 [Entrophospora sp. SA101]
MGKGLSKGAAASATIDSSALNNYYKIFPDDENEKKRQHLRHNLMREVFKSNFSSPVHDVLNTGWARVLDVGCGTGTWLFEMSADFPGCNFIGTDILVPLKSELKPFDVKFEEADVVDGLPYDNDSFDFIFLRFNLFDYSEVEWENVIKELIRTVKPGGWIEANIYHFLMETELVVNNAGPATEMLLNAGKYSFISLKNTDFSGFNLIWPEILESLPELASLHLEKKHMPIGKWGGKLGESGAEFMKGSYEAMLSKFNRYLGVKPKDFDKYLKIYMDEAETNKSSLIVHLNINDLKKKLDNQQQKNDQSSQEQNKQGLIVSSCKLGQIISKNQFTNNYSSASTVSYQQHHNYDIFDEFSELLKNSKSNNKNNLAPKKINKYEINDKKQSRKNLTPTTPIPIHVSKLPPTTNIHTNVHTTDRNDTAPPPKNVTSPTPSSAPSSSLFTPIPPLSVSLLPPSTKTNHQDAKQTNFIGNQSFVDDDDNDAMTISKANSMKPRKSQKLSPSTTLLL